MENNWHIIEYTQLPIHNTPLVELTIKINGTAQHKIINNEAQEYGSIQVYYGHSNYANSDEVTVPDGKIRNFRIDESESGKKWKQKICLIVLLKTMASVFVKMVVIVMNLKIIIYVIVLTDLTPRRSFLVLTMYEFLSIFFEYL